MARSDLTAQRLREVLQYDADSGIFSRSIAKPGARLGPIASVSSHHKGYLLIRVDGVRYAAHRLVWLHITGMWPNGQIDHINGRRADNRFCNLRDVDQYANQQNQVQAQANNRLGLRGVHEAHGGFIAQITVRKAKIHLGLFRTAQEASDAYWSGKARLHADLPRLRP